MKKIIITIPCGKEKWKISFGATPSNRNTATTIYALLKRKIYRHLASQLRGKTAVVVKDGQEVVNETLGSSDTSYLLYTTACFWEDYLTPGYLKQIEKEYGQ